MISAKRVFACSAVVSLCFQVGCVSVCEDDGLGGSSDSAMVKGYVFGGLGVFLVACPADALPGALPIEGAEVRVLLIDKTVAATATTASDGSFLIEGLPTGFLTLEVRVNPSSAAADAFVSVTGYPGARIFVNRVFPISREDARQIALSIAEPDDLVLGTMQPVSAGADVRELLDLGDPVRELLSDEWLFYIDRNPMARFTHGTEYVFVDAYSGEMTRVEDLSWSPQVNGGFLWEKDQEYYHYEGFDANNFDPDNLPADAKAIPSQEVVQLPPLPALDATARAAGSISKVLQSLKHNTDPESIFVLIVQGSEESAAMVDDNKMVDFFRAAGLQVGYQIRLVPTGLFDRPGLGGTGKEYKTDLRFINEEISSRLDRGEHSTLIFYYVGHSFPDTKGRIGPAGKAYMAVKWKGDKLGVWDASDLDLTSTKACRVRVILEMCNAELFAKDLAAEFAGTEHDLTIFASSSATGEALAVPIALQVETNGAIKAGSLFSNQFRQTATIENGDIGNVVDGSGNLDADMTSRMQVFSRLLGYAYQGPKVILRPDDPSWCVHPGEGEIGVPGGGSGVDPDDGSGVDPGSEEEDTSDQTDEQNDENAMLGSPPVGDSFFAETESESSTLYTVVGYDPDGDALTFKWWTPSCGGLEHVFDSSYDSAVAWSYPNPPCDAEFLADEAVMVTIYDGTWEVTGTYTGVDGGGTPTWSAPTLVE